MQLIAEERGIAFEEVVKAREASVIVYGPTK